MAVEKSAGAIIFYKDKEVYYLLLNYSAYNKIEKSYWGFAKGHIEAEENEIDTIKREVREETGIEDIKIISGFREKEKYFFKFKNKNILKFVVFYLAQANSKKVNLSFEHIDYTWLPLEKAVGKLTFKSAKEILQKADNFLKQKPLA